MTGSLLASFNLAQTVNGVSGHDSAVFVGHNQYNGQTIEARNPANYGPVFSFPSPLEYPNGLAFDGQYLWICGRHQWQDFIVKVDVGVSPPPVTVPFDLFELIADGKYNTDSRVAFDSQGFVHMVYSGQPQLPAPSQQPFVLPFLANWYW